MSRILTLFLVVILFLCSGQVSFAAGGGGVDGGGGGGAAVPGRERRGSGPTGAYKDGIALLAEGECKKAEKKFKAVLKAVPRNSEANTLRGIALQCQLKFQASIRYFKRAKRDDSQFYMAYEKLGLSYLALDRAEYAEDEYRELSRFKKSCEFRNRKCPPSLLKSHKKLKEAIERTLGKVPETEEDSDQHGLLFAPDGDPQASYLGAVSLINSERFEEAIEKLRGLTGALGPHPDVLNYLGYAHRRLGRFEQAEMYYEQALAIDPLHRGANEYLGEMWVELGRIDDARARLAQLEAACPFGCTEFEDLKRIIESRLVAAN